MGNKSSWGGYREGAGQKPKWNLGETKPLRLPVKLHEDILAIAHLIDSSECTKEQLLNFQHDTVTQSNLDNDTLSNQLRDLIDKWQEKAKTSTSPRWSQAKKLLAELEVLLQNKES